MTHTATKVMYAFLFQTLLCLQYMASMTAADGTASDTVESIFDSANGVKVGGSVLAVLAMAAGAVICLAGYKLFRPTLFAIGFVVGGVLIAIAAEEIFKNKSWMHTASWIAFVVGGLIVGCLVISLYTTSIFVAGAAGGVLLAILLNTSFGYRIYPSNPNVVLIVLAIALGIIGGVLSLKLEKPILITATSLVGAGLAVWGIGYFAGDYPTANDLKSFAEQDANGDWIYSVPDAWWAYLAGTLVLFIIGMVSQFHKTGRGEHHHQSRALPARSAQQQPEFTAVQTPQEKDQRNVHYGNPVSHV